MSSSTAVRLRHGAVAASVLPAEGGVLVDATIGGRPVLAATPWADAVIPSSRPAATEAEWVGRWRGGWQLCFPTAGQPDATATPLQGFHGTASQAPWTVVAVTDDTATLRWADDDGLGAERTWRLVDAGLRVDTRVRHRGGTDRRIVVAEHLILGGDVLAAPLSLVPGRAAGLRALDADGRPPGDPVPWPGPPSERWATVDARTPARMAALTDPDPRVIRIDGAHLRASVAWTGAALPHTLLWQELGVSTEPPWNSAVRALGVEPSSAAHGVGTALGEGAIVLAPGETTSWSVELTVRWTNAAASMITAAPPTTAEETP